MNVLVIANDMQREELLYMATNDGLQYTWIKSTDGFKTNIPPDVCIDLLFHNNPERIEWLQNLKSPLVIINSVVIPLSEIGGDFIRINAWNTLLRRPVIEAAGDNPLLRDKAEKFFSRIGRKIKWIDDIPGFITSRIIASIINEAFFALEENVSTKDQIDTAMKLGTNYPYGPFEWAGLIGIHQVYLLLVVLSKKQERYQPSQLLKQSVLA